MEEERTLLQQIRDKELEFSKKIEQVKRETETQIAAAKIEREKNLLEAERTGKVAAEEQYLRVQQATEKEIDGMKKAAIVQISAAKKKGKKDLQPAIQRIIGYVTLK